MSVKVDEEKYHPLYVQFIYYFNRERDYFECHEVLEELWLEEGRDLLYQGLLQVAVALYHYRNGNRNGARKLFYASLQKLAPYPGDSLGIDLNQVREDSKVYLERLQREEEFPFYDLNIRILDPLLAEKVQALIEKEE
ncbi:DUF309 domain-containing protein [Kroppenstedtia pulmonis]|uniref:DUF309 domain-containing protein n=1 Tax=Kroppenstedtia pulmonis TaxID=1380685 RepID=A0A7D4BUZ4_9BACL|nr:DUF309 domain-containing protein [Kroppenstedtia pulmonis]QKG83533.1 DUF309 domain-containing protein [Kroppenstedtia pulmonis]